MALAYGDILEGRAWPEGVDESTPAAYQGPDAAILRDFDRLVEDPAVVELIRRGYTMGCFYIESPAMRQLFQKMRCTTYEEVVAASSVIRPGVAESGMMKTYIERHARRGDAYDEPHADRRTSTRANRNGVREFAGRAATRCAVAGHFMQHFPAAGDKKNGGPDDEYLHPKLKEILSETHGVMIYQEDVIKVAHRLGGMTLGEADLLRRAMSGKMRSRDAMQQLKDKFFLSCRRQGIEEEVVAEIWRQIESFAGYSFCKGHSAAFAVLSYQTAWLKAHYPAEFIAGVLANGGGFYGPGAYVSEGKRMGLRFLPPDVNRSAPHYAGRTLRTPDVTQYSLPFAEARRRPPLGWVRVGLLAVKDVSLASIRAIVEKRRWKPYESLEDFLARTGVGREECDRLIRAGAFDAFGSSRPEHLLRLDTWFNRPYDTESLF